MNDNSFNKPSDNIDNDQNSQNDWDKLAETEERRTLIDAVKEKFKQPRFAKAVGRTLIVLTTAAAIGTVIAQVGKKMDKQKLPYELSSPEVTESTIELADSTEEQDTPKSLTSIYWVGSKKLHIGLNDGSGKEDVISVDEARNPETYKERLGVDDEVANEFVEKYNDLFERMKLEMELESEGRTEPRDLDTFGWILEEESDIASRQGPIEYGDLSKIRAENDEKIDSIIAELDLKNTDDILEQIENCRKVSEYIVMHNQYDDAVMDEKAQNSGFSMRDMDLHSALVDERGVCTSYSVEFEEILKRVGMDVKTVTLISKEGGTHACNLVNIRGEYYYFDTTLEQTIYNMQKELDPDTELVLCCAGLGKKEYEEFYMPVVIITSEMETEGIPNNISEERIPFEIANGLYNPEE